MDGYTAVLLWQRYQRGDKGALDLLLSYNREDVVNLEVLMDGGLRDGPGPALPGWPGRAADARRPGPSSRIKGRFLDKIHNFYVG